MVNGTCLGGVLPYIAGYHWFGFSVLVYTGGILEMWNLWSRVLVIVLHKAQGLLLRFQVQVGVSFFYTNGEQKSEFISQYQPK